MALEPRGTWHLQKRQGHHFGPGSDFDSNGLKTDDGTPLFADYHYYDFNLTIDQDYGREPDAETFRDDFYRATVVDGNNDLSHAG